MPKKKGKPIAKILLVVVIVVAISVSVVAWHDGLIGVTEISDILTVSDGSNFVGFEWTGASTLNSIVVVRGVVGSLITLTDVTSVEIVWIITGY